MNVDQEVQEVWKKFKYSDKYGHAWVFPDWARNLEWNDTYLKITPLKKAIRFKYYVLINNDIIQYNGFSPRWQGYANSLAEAMVFGLRALHDRRIHLGLDTHPNWEDLVTYPGRRTLETRTSGWDFS